MLMELEMKGNCEYNCFYLLLQKDIVSQSTR